MSMNHALESLESRRLLSATASISGSVYKDLNANAKHEAGEAGVKKVRLYLDANNDAQWDSKRETSVLTDKRGQFEFTGLSAGTYRLRQVLTGDYTVVGPRSGWFKITLADGQHVVRRQFANRVNQTTVNPTGGTTGGTTGTSSVIYSGDTDLNGVVNFDDYSRIDDAFNTPRTGWYNGDFDYNGVVSFDDYSLIDQAFNTQSGTLQRAIAYLDGSDRSSNGLNSPSLQQVVEHFNQFGDDYADTFLDTVNTPPPAAPSIKSIARADFKLTHDDHSLLSAKSWLTGNKDVIRSSGLQTVIDHYHQFGVNYKREFLKLAKSY